jgi:amino acid adenylation domain-containing protein
MQNLEDIYELTPTQHGILFHSLHAPEEGLYCQQMRCAIEGDLDPAAFRDAWQKIVDRHPVFRTSFHWEQLEKPMQVVHKKATLPWEYNDWRAHAPDEQQERLENFLESDRGKGYNLSQEPLLRMTLIRTAERVYQAIWSFHHILIDGWCLPIILKEVFVFYEAISKRQEVNLPRGRHYRDYIVWLQRQDLSKAEAFWRKELAGFESPTPLIKNEVLITAPGRVKDHSERIVDLPPAIAARLHAFARQHQITLNTLTQGAWALLLSRYSGKEDVVFGATLAARPISLPGADGMIGLFINTLPVRVLTPSDEVVLPWLKNVQRWMAEMRQYEHSPLVQVHGWSEVPRTLPLFESLFVFENYPIDPSLQERRDGLQVREVKYTNWNNYPLTMVVIPGPKFMLRIHYDCRRFDEPTVERALDHYQTLLEAICSNPDRRLLDLPLLTEQEERRLLVDLNDATTDFSRDELAHELFDAQAMANPHAIAAVFEDEQLSYGELGARANQLAHYLRSRGVSRDMLVGVFLKRSLDMVVAILGVLKAGGGYFPLDPALPRQRLAYMLEDSMAPIVLTNERFAQELPDCAAQVVALDREWGRISQESDSDPVSVTTGLNAAYVIYTSGSTGKPKGVIIEHRQILNYVHGFRRRAELRPGASYAMAQPLTVDSCKTVVFPSLCCGGRLHLISQERATDPFAMIDYFSRHEIDLLKITPSHLAALQTSGLKSRVLPRRWLIIGGEASRSDWVKDICRAAPDCKVFNHYGPTEATVGMLMFRVEKDWESGGVPIVPMGRPLANTRAYVLDRYLRPVPVGLPGELHIGGDCLARGYLGHPDKTAEKFIPNPFPSAPGERLYKTGDITRHLPEGSILFLGRADDQIKIRGFRIELKEIEAELNEHPLVRDSIVIAREDASGEKRLVAFVVADAEMAPSINELRAYLKERLPEYMIASTFVVLDALPLTPHGKVDRQALQAAELPKSEGDEFHVAPRTALEELIAGIWSALIGVKHIGAYDNFFELGGHSLSAAQLIFRLNEVFQIELPVSHLFKSPTIAGLVVSIIEKQAEKVESEKVSQILTEIEQLSEEESQWILVSR